MGWAGRIRSFRTFHAAFILVPLLLILSGCASTREIDYLRSDVNSLKAESGAQKKEISQLRDRVAQVSKDSTASSALIESQSTLLKQSGDLSKEVQGLRGQFDENKYQTDRKIRELTAEREIQQARMRQIEEDLKDIKAKLGILPAEKKPDQPPAAEKAPQAPDPKAPKAFDASDPQQLYDSGYGDFKEKRYADARQKFEKFTKDFPKHALLPNAYFWIGESYYNDKKYEDAILSYESVVKKFPSDNKARAAMLKQGYSFIELGDKKTGKVILERVMEKYPRSPEAELAEKKIAELLAKDKPKTQPQTQKKKK